jgi:hypothetical protein
VEFPILACLVFPSIFLRNFISVLFILLLCFCVGGHVSEQYVRIGMAIFLSISIFISLGIYLFAKNSFLTY